MEDDFAPMWLGELTLGLVHFVEGRSDASLLTQPGGMGVAVEKTARNSYCVPIITICYR